MTSSFFQIFIFSEISLVWINQNKKTLFENESLPDKNSNTIFQLSKIQFFRPKVSYQSEKIPLFGKQNLSNALLKHSIYIYKLTIGYVKNKRV